MKSLGPGIVLQALRFDTTATLPQGLSDADWEEILRYTDRYQLTLLFARTALNFFLLCNASFGISR